MCRFCDHIAAEIRRLDERLRETQARHSLGRPRTLKWSERQQYYRDYYQKNRERKLAQAKARHARRREALAASAGK